MRPEERVIRAINYKETDRVPFGFPGAVPITMDRLKSFINAANDEEVQL